MGDALGQETQDSLRQMANRIAVANGLDDAIQEELYGHLEDKTLGYLSGEEAVSEQDAVVLAREHFGDPRTLKELLSSVHAVESTASTWRRIAAVAILTMSIGVVGSGIVKAAVFLTAVLGEGEWLETPGIRHLTTLAPDGVALLVAVFVLLGWRRRERASRTLWYETWAPKSLVVALAAALAAWLYMPGVVVAESQQLGQLARSVPLWRVWLDAALTFAVPLLWVWWCDARPRRWLSVMKGAGAWAGLTYASFVSRLIAGQPVLEIGQSGDFSVAMKHSNRLLAFGASRLYELSVTLGVAIALALGTAALYALFVGSVSLYRRWRPVGA